MTCFGRTSGTTGGAPSPPVGGRTGGHDVGGFLAATRDRRRGPPPGPAGRRPPGHRVRRLAAGRLAVRGRRRPRRAVAARRGRAVPAPGGIPAARLPPD